MANMATVLFLLVVANGAPILMKMLFKSRFAWPLDGGIKLLDGWPLFGPAKTVRGIVASFLLTGCSALFLGCSFGLGATVALLAMAGDLLASFTKRRMGLQASSAAVGLDQIPESLLPAVLLRSRFALQWTDIALLVAAFFLIDFILSWVLSLFHLHKRPF